MLRILVAIASYGTGNDNYLRRLIAEYQSMPFHIDIVILSNIEKKPLPEIECLVGLPDKNPWSLPFAHKKVFADRAEQYDLFIYSEDDILITERNLLAFQKVTSALLNDEVVGFLRFERDAGGRINYPDIHGFFHWDCTSVRRRGQYTLAHFTNDHSACYVLTQTQLKAAIESKGFLVAPHERKYDLLCAAATDPYTQCGMKKYIPISDLNDFLVHHLSNKYADKVGVGEMELNHQLYALSQIAENRDQPIPLFQTCTKLPRGEYSKLYYDTSSFEVTSVVPASAQQILSVGCGWGATEAALIKEGRRVAAIPLDPVIASNAVSRGLEMVYGIFDTALASLQGERFDCVLYLNVLHLIEDPANILLRFRSICSPNALVIIQSPNMKCLPALWRRVRDRRFDRLGDFCETGVHKVSARRLNEWCRRSGYRVENILGIRHTKLQNLSSVPAVELLMSPDLICVARIN